MQKKHTLFLLLICICISIIAYKKTNIVHNDTPSILNAEESKVSAQDETDELISQFTGEKITKKVLNSPQFMAIIENSKDARPQSGISEADIVYETMVEGGISRFIALFNKNIPKEIGPIRSARPYLLDISTEYNIPIAHCGGSEEALIKIQKEDIKSLNEFSNNSSYWRDNSRIAPHNLYTSSEKITEIMKQKNYINKSPIKPIFDENYWLDNNLPFCNDVNLIFNKNYSTNYIYKNGLYYKYMNGEPSIDKSNKKPITSKNIVIQITNINLQNDGQHLDVNLIGEGNGYLISNGKYEKIKWYKKDFNSPTILKTENDSIIPLSPGNTWWHIIDSKSSIEIK